jgi:hypothetical protein
VTDVGDDTVRAEDSTSVGVLLHAAATTVTAESTTMAAVWLVHLVPTPPQSTNCKVRRCQTFGLAECFPRSRHMPTFTGSGGLTFLAATVGNSITDTNYPIGRCGAQNHYVAYNYFA